MTSNDLSDLKPVYLIWGSEELLLERAVRRLQDRLAAAADLDFNMELFDGDNSSADDVTAAANTMPFMSDRRLVIVRDVDRMPSAELGKLSDYAADPAPYTCLVLTATKVNRGTRLYKAVDALGGVAEYKPPKRSEYPAYIAKMFADHGKSAGLDVSRMLFESVGGNLRRLDSEIEKITAYMGEAQKVTAAVVETVVSAGGPVSIFEYLDAWGTRDAAEALGRLTRLLDSGESLLGVHAMGVRHLRALISARALMDRGVRVDQMAPVLGLAPWQVRKVAGQAGTFTQTELSEALRDAARVEAEIKSGPVDGRIVLERWVIGVCAADPARTTTPDRS